MLQFPQEVSYIVNKCRDMYMLEINLNKHANSRFEKNYYAQSQTDNVWTGVIF